MRHKDAVLMICARRIFPYELRLPGVFGGFGSSVTPLSLNVGELCARASCSTDGWELVDADVARDVAVCEATTALLRAVQPGNALYAKYDPHVRSAMFVHYPVFYARYRYDGEARRHPGEELFVAISARTGKPIAARHPSAIRSAAAKIRRLLTFA